MRFIYFFYQQHTHWASLKRYEIFASFFLLIFLKVFSFIHTITGEQYIFYFFTFCKHLFLMQILCCRECLSVIPVHNTDIFIPGFMKPSPNHFKILKTIFAMTRLLWINMISWWLTWSCCWIQQCSLILFCFCCIAKHCIIRFNCILKVKQ